MNCVFCKIRDREIVTTFLYEDDHVMAINDIHPVKPVHVLIIPKQHVEDFVYVQDGVLWEKVMTVAQNMAKQYLAGKKFRVAINAGGAQDVPHLHVHVMGPLQSGNF